MPVGSVLGEAARKPSKELNQELQRTKRQSVNLGTVGLCAQGQGLPRCKQKAEPCPAGVGGGGRGAGPVATGRKAEAGPRSEPVARR